MTRALYAWRGRVLSEAGPPSAVRRAVLMGLWYAQERAHYGSGQGSASVRELATWTGLHQRTVRRHLRIAADEGWAESLATSDAQRWVPRLGDGVVL